MLGLMLCRRRCGGICAIGVDEIISVFVDVVKLVNTLA